MELRLERNQELEDKIEEAGLDLMELGHGGRLRIKLRRNDITENRELVSELMRAAYDGSKG